MNLRSDHDLCRTSANFAGRNILGGAVSASTGAGAKRSQAKVFWGCERSTTHQRLHRRSQGTLDTCPLVKQGNISRERARLAELQYTIDILHLHEQR
jgi:hypothetical protein